MADHATPNLPSRDFDATLAFYAPLGFAKRYRDEDWMILERGSVMLEFFPHPELDPWTSWFSCCIRFDDVDAFTEVCRAAGVPEAPTGQPRLNAARRMPWGGRMGALVDPDGSLVRLLDN